MDPPGPIASQGASIGVFCDGWKSSGVVVKTGNRAFLLALLLAIGPAFAAEDVGLGPWRLGMSKEQVTAFAEQGPYTDIAGGGLETAAGKFKDKKVATSFTFANATLRSMVVKVYEGTEWRKAETATLDVYDYFKANYGGANVKDTADNPDRDALDLLLRQTLGTAEDMNKRFAPNGQYFLQTFDMIPRRQPAEGRLHCQWIYDGKRNMFTIVLYLDLPSAPKRDVAENDQIKKL
jgi:hypothetical protein